VQRADGKPEVIPNREFEDTTPSAVYFPPDGAEELVLVGIEAKNQVATASEDVVQLVKRAMGNREFRFITSGGAEFTAEAVSALILKRLVADAAEALGEPVTDVVVTVPAYFDDARRTATRDAAQIAGLNVLGLLNEPTAAALAFGLESGHEGTVLVYDLGGGTFDVTILKIADNHYQELVTMGDAELGGADFDNEIVKLVARSIQEQGGTEIDFDDLALMAVMQEKAEQAKRALTVNTAANISLALGGKVYRTKVTRQEFEDAAAYLLYRTEELTEAALEEGGLTWDQIDRVLLVGGSSKMPMVPAMIERLTGKAPERHVHPDLAVALGAAIRAAILQTETSAAGATGAAGQAAPDGANPGQSGSPLFIGGQVPTLQNVASHALGVITLADNLKTKVNTVVIPRNSEIPGSFTVEVSTVGDRQTSMMVEVTQGDDPDPAYVTVVGQKSLPIPPYPQGAPFRISYHYDIDQIIFVEVEDLTAGEKLGSFEVDRSRNLGEEGIRSEAVKVNALDIA
jgi:molecular chaperone DnaK